MSRPSSKKVKNDGKPSRYSVLNQIMVEARSYVNSGLRPGQKRFNALVGNSGDLRYEGYDPSKEDLEWFELVKAKYAELRAERGI